MIEFTGKARIKHNKTGTIYDISAKDLCVEQADVNEKSMGVEIVWSATLDHTDLGELSWTACEYPPGVLEDLGGDSRDVGPHEVIEDFDISAEMN